MTTWNPNQYLKFAEERTQPSVDLAKRVKIVAPGTVIDVGCGPGNSTRVLRERWPKARIVGLDNSPEMIAQARRDFPKGEWMLADAATLSDTVQYDVVFSNAVLQWIPDHETLLPRLMRAVAPGGCLAVQIPYNRESPLHKALIAVAASPRWSGYLSACSGMLHYRTAEEVYGIVNGLGNLDLWETNYYHVLASHRDLIEWYKATGMRPYLEKLPGDEARSQFEDEVLQACRADYPIQNNGKVLYPFKRIFFIVYR